MLKTRAPSELHHGRREFSTNERGKTELSTAGLIECKSVLNGQRQSGIGIMQIAVAQT